MEKTYRNGAVSNPLETFYAQEHESEFHLFQIVPGLPKTRSGKIMRRILRKIASNQPEELGDISTLANPAVVQLIVQKHAAIRNGK